METSFSQKVKEVIKGIPAGKVATYGQVAACAGNPWGARQVAWVLHAASDKDHLPWHRVVNRQGKISLKRRHGYERQKALLLSEGVAFDAEDTIDFERYLWSPEDSGSRKKD